MDLGPTRECHGRLQRVQVNINILQPLQWGVFAELDETGETATILLKYERLLELCHHCGIINHMLGECPDAFEGVPTLNTLDYGPWIRGVPPSKSNRSRVKRKITDGKARLLEEPTVAHVSKPAPLWHEKKAPSTSTTSKTVTLLQKGKISKAISTDNTKGKNKMASTPPLIPADPPFLFGTSFGNKGITIMEPRPATTKVTLVVSNSTPTEKLAFTPNSLTFSYSNVPKANTKTPDMISKLEQILQSSFSSSSKDCLSDGVFHFNTLIDPSTPRVISSTIEKKPTKKQHPGSHPSSCKKPKSPNKNKNSLCKELFQLSCLWGLHFVMKRKLVTDNAFFVYEKKKTKPKNNMTDPITQVSLESSSVTLVNSEPPSSLLVANPDSRGY